MARKKDKGHLASKELEAAAQKLLVRATDLHSDTQVLGIRAEDLALLAVDYLSLIQEHRRAP